MDTNLLPRCTPESQGISTAAIARFVEEVERNVHELHSFMLLRHGAVVAEGWWSPYGPEHPHMLFSLSKSFTSTAVGLAAAEGRLSVNDLVISFFPEDVPAEISENLRAMRVKNLLSMSTGHQDDTTDRITNALDSNWVKAFLSLPVEFKPGTHFVYNSGASYMLAAIVQKVTGMMLLDYLQPRLLAPLGISGATWEVSPQGINMGGWGLKIKTEDIARFGQLYLQKGQWQGQQILPEAWVAEASAKQVSNGGSPESDWEQGYGYQFWRCRNNAFRGDGAFGQYCIVMPEKDAVLAITSGVEDMQQVLNVVWTCLLPEMGPAPVVKDREARAALQQKLGSLALLPPQGAKTSAAAALVSGKEYKMEPNDLKVEGAYFDFSGDGCVFTIHGSTSPDAPAVLRLGGIVGEHTIACGSGAWREGMTALFGRGESQPMVASGVWTAEDTYSITVRIYETPFFFNFNCQFDGSQVTVQMAQNVGFGPKEAPKLVGRS